MRSRGLGLLREIVAVLLLVLLPVTSATASFIDNFDGTAIQSAYWTPVGTGAISVAGGAVNFACSGSMYTKGKYEFSGDQIVIEGRFVGTGAMRDSAIILQDASAAYGTGELIHVGDTTYQNQGLYSAASGAFNLPQVGYGVSAAVYKEYRLTLTGTSLVWQRGDTLANITETVTRTMGSSIAGRTFYLVIGTGVGYCPATFDWISVRAPLSGISLSAIGLTSLAFNATSDRTGTGYWLAVPKGGTAPTSAQVKSGVNYAGVAIAASGSGAMTANAPAGFAIRNLGAGTAYDFYLVVADANGALGTTPVKVQGSTLPESTTITTSTFFFDPIASMAKGVAGTVGIRAVDAQGLLQTNFNEEVWLTANNHNTVTPNKVRFAAGVATPSITFLTGNTPTALLAQWTKPDGTQVAGWSLPVAVQDLGAQLAFSASGRTRPGAAVVLQDGTGATVASALADANTGKFDFGTVASGTYKLVATLTNSSQQCPAGGCMETITSNRNDLNPKLRSNRQPVILIPGVMGSTLKGKAISYYGTQTPRDVADHVVHSAPKLPQEKCKVGAYCALRDNLEIYDPEEDSAVGITPAQCDSGSSGAKKCTVMGSHLLIQKLYAAGFEVYPAPWDWRQPVAEAAEIYLKPVIEDAMRASGWPRVHVVAHSMGGLVTRYYIEKMGLGANIDRFVMLGTPNKGSTNAYFLMEGGDPRDLDKLTNDWQAGTFAQAAFYTATANELWRTYFGSDMVTGLSWDGDVQASVSYAKGITTRDLRDFMRLVAPGGRDLLPTYDFLRQWTPIPSSLTHTDADQHREFLKGALSSNVGMNTTLRMLNDPVTWSFGKYYTGGPQGPSGNLVFPTLLLSNSVATMREVGYQTKGTSTYTAGTPDSAANFGDRRIVWGNGCTNQSGAECGDGTVLALQAVRPFPDTVVLAHNYDTHPRMVGLAATDVCVVMGASLAACSAPAMTANVAAVAAAPSVATFEMDGVHSALLTAADGKRAGTQAGLPAIYEEIANSGVAVTPYIDRVALESPANGSYSLLLSADSGLVNTTMRLQTTYLQSGVGTQRGSVRLLVQATPYRFGVTLDTAAARWLTLQDPVTPPLALRAVPQADMTALSWTAPADATVTGYRVYYLPEASVVYTLLGETTQTSFVTSVPWAGTLMGAREFVVVSINASGVQSPIRDSNSILNLSYARAAFTATQVGASGTVTLGIAPATANFVSQSDATAAIQSYAWDFGDGSAIDTAASPTHTYAQGGTYNVSLTVTSADGSTDTTTRVAFVTVLKTQSIGTIGFAHGLIVGGNTTAYALSSSGQPVVFASATPQVCTASGINGSVVTALAAGTCTIVANQPGNVEFGAAPSVVTSFAVTQQLVVNPSALAFGAQSLGVASAPQTVVLTNAGQVSLTLGAMEATIAEFVPTSACSGVLAAGDSCTVSVVFKPSVYGTRLGALRVNSSMPTSPDLVVLTGAAAVSTLPLCRLDAAPRKVKRNQSTVLTASCNPAASSYVWTGGGCAGQTGATCTDVLQINTTYTVQGVNGNGAGSLGSAIVTVGSSDIAPILMLLLD